MHRLARILLALVLAPLAAVWLVVPARAATTIANTQAGWYDATGAHSIGIDNIFTGNCCGAGEHRAYWVFNLALAPAARSIDVTFYGTGLFVTDSGSETVGIYDYTGSTTALHNGTAGTAGFADLGSGQLGAQTITAGNYTAMPAFTFALPTSFVTQYNAARLSPERRIALGAALLSLTSAGTADEGFWGASTGTGFAQLSIDPAPVTAVPEPATWLSLGLGLGLTALVLRRRGGPVRPAAA